AASSEGTLYKPIVRSETFTGEEVPPVTEYVNKLVVGPVIEISMLPSPAAHDVGSLAATVNCGVGLIVNVMASVMVHEVIGSVTATVYSKTPGVEVSTACVLAVPAGVPS